VTNLLYQTISERIELSVRRGETYFMMLLILTVPLSTTFSTSPVFLDRCHLRDRLHRT